MSQAPPPYGGYPPYPPPVPPQRRKPRPSGWWFVVGTALVVAAIIAAIGLFWWTLSAFLDSDATISADGRPHEVSVGTDRDRMIWLESGRPEDCRVVDARTGDPIPLDPVGAAYTRSDSGGDWHGVARFDPGSGDLVVTCDGGGSALISPAPRIGSFVVGILATILVPLLLGLAGLVTLIVTGILWATRPSRAEAG